MNETHSYPTQEMQVVITYKKFEAIEMSSKKMITRIVFDADKKRMVRKQVVDRPIYPAPAQPKLEMTHSKPLVEKLIDLTEDRGTLEMDKWELLYCLYGRANVRFG